VSPCFADDLALALKNHACTAKVTSDTGRHTPVARQLVVDSHGATLTTPRYRWDYRRPGAWLPLSMRDPDPAPFEPDVRYAFYAPSGPERKTWRGWWGTLQRTSTDAEATAMRETA
jgi:hypothetical protein